MADLPPPDPHLPEDPPPLPDPHLPPHEDPPPLPAPGLPPHGPHPADPRTYPVQKVRDVGGPIFLISVPKEGPRLLPYLCNALILRNVMNLGAVDNVSEDHLVNLISEMLLVRLDGDPFEDVRSTVAMSLIKDQILEPEFDAVDSFVDAHDIDALVFSISCEVPLLHGHVLDQVSLVTLELQEERYFSLSKKLKKKLRTHKHKPLGPKWTTINNLLSSHSQYSLNNLIKRMQDQTTAVFWWKGHFSTIRLHNGEAFVLEPAASCLVKEVHWQRLSVITDEMDPERYNFLDCSFIPATEHRETLKLYSNAPVDGPLIDDTAFNVFQPLHLRGVIINDDGELRNEMASDETKMAEIIRMYGVDFVENSAAAVISSIQRNTRLVNELKWSVLSLQMKTIISDHLEVYRICVAAEERLMTSDLELRQVKESVLSFVDIFLQRDELEEDVEDSIISLVQILLSEYFSKRHDEMPPSFQQLSLHVVKKFRHIDHIFEPAFVPRQVALEPAKYSYLFFLLATISSFHFELLENLPVRMVLMGFSEAVKLGKLSIDDNLNPMLEFLENFTNNITIGYFAGPVLNQVMEDFFETLVFVYCFANGAKETPKDNLRSLEAAMFKLVEAFLLKAEDSEHLENKYVIPLMLDACAKYMEDATEMSSSFLSLSQMIIKTCNNIESIFDRLFSSSNKMMYEHHGYVIMLLNGVCTHCPQVFTKLSLQQLKHTVEFIRWAVKHRESNIVISGMKLLLQFLLAFEAPECHNSFCKEHLLGIEEDILTALLGSQHPDQKKISIDLLKQMFNAADKMSVPIWNEATVPIHYNSMFVKEHAAKFLQSNMGGVLYSVVAGFVDNVYLARNDYSDESSTNLLNQLKKHDTWKNDFSRVSTSNETPAVSSNQNSQLFDATSVELMKKRLHEFLAKYIAKDCHAPYYEGVVFSMYVTGEKNFRINFNHVISHDSSLAIDIVQGYNGFQHTISRTVLAYISHLKNKLDVLFKESASHLSKLSLCGDTVVIFIDMPRSIAKFTDFIKVPGNEIVKKMTLFDGPDSVIVEKKTELGILALASYVQQVCELHAAGDSFDGKFDISHFLVFDGSEFKICYPLCGYSNWLSEKKDFCQMGNELLPHFGNSEFIARLMETMLAYIPDENNYSPRLARQFRFSMMIHPARKNSVLRAMIFVDTYRAFRLLQRMKNIPSLSTTMEIEMDFWRDKAIKCPILKKLYNFLSLALINELRKMQELHNQQERQRDREDAGQGQQGVVQKLADQGQQGVVQKLADQEVQQQKPDEAGHAQQGPVQKLADQEVQQQKPNEAGQALQGAVKKIGGGQEEQHTKPDEAGGLSPALKIKFGALDSYNEQSQQGAAEKQGHEEGVREGEDDDKQLEVLSHELKLLSDGRFSTKIDEAVKEVKIPDDAEDHGFQDPAIEAHDPLFHSQDTRGNLVYKPTLSSFTEYFRHGIMHLGDPVNAGFRTRIKKLIEHELLLCHVMSDEMLGVLTDMIETQIPDEFIEMIEESWQLFVRPETNRPYSEPLGLRDYRNA